MSTTFKGLAQPPKAHLIREALGKDRAVFVDPNIHATKTKRHGGRKIVSRAVALNCKAAVCNAQQWVREAVAKKLEKHYPEPSMLVVRVVPDRNLSLREWADVADCVPRRNERNQFDFIYLVDTNSGQVFCVG